MPIYFHDKDALITAALAAGKPVAFLVGSPLSTQDGLGVPGVPEMLNLIRTEIQQRATNRLSSFEDSIRGKSSGEAYQAAMIWLNGNLLQDGVNRVVQTAVRLARKDGTDSAFNCDGNYSDWNIPTGTKQIAALICRDRERFPGPILTTNFDPLLSLAIEACGAKPHLRVIQADGGLGQDVKRTGETEIIHLHGFWRDSDTLHSPAQLMAPRPRLKDSLKEILRQKTLIVAAYGGWDDVFATALAEVAIDDAAQVNVLWCFRDTEPTNIEHDYRALFQRVQPAITRGRFVAYRGIECHSIFGEIAAALPAVPASVIPVAAGGLSPIAGWQLIDVQFLDALPALTNGEIIRYFDGAVPTWRHAVCPTIPRRQDAEKLTARLAQLAHDNFARSMHLIRAAGGEGKSTMLLQVAADVARAGDWSVLWRTSPKEGISPEQVTALHPARRWLIVADDADNIVPGLADSARGVGELNRNGVHFLLAARDADWKNAQGSRQPWAEWLDSFPDIVLRGITANDAKVVLTAWEGLGPDGLRELAAISDSAERIAAFESAVRDAVGKQDEQARRHRPQEGSFFGGLLAVRFGQNGLQAHVRAFLHRLNAMRIEGGKGTLFDALLYVAACHGAGIPGIDEKVLADLVGVPREWVQRRVVRPLGEEASAVQSAGQVLTRHSQVAAAVLVEAEQTLGIDLAEIWAQLVRQTVKTARSTRIGPTFSYIVHAGHRLQKALPQQIPEQRRKVIAVAAATADVAAESNRLIPLVDLAKTYRHAGEFEQAAQIFRENLPTTFAKVDYNKVIRGYWYEWSVCEGERPAATGDANSWLAGLSLSDHLNPAPITPDDVKLICAGLGVAFGKLAKDRPDCPFVRGVRAIAWLGKRVRIDRRALDYFKIHHKKADAVRAPHPSDVPEAISWLAAAVVHAGRQLQDPFLKELLNPHQVSFKLLQEFLDNVEAPRVQRRATHRRSIKQPVPAVDASKPLRLKSNLEPRVEEGINRVAREAWEAAAFASAQDERLRIAKQEAIRVIATLSPSIRKQVNHHFMSEKWQPLIKRKPKA